MGQSDTAFAELDAIERFAVNDTWSVTPSIDRFALFPGWMR
jgi:hypothetical protein